MFSVVFGVKGTLNELLLTEEEDDLNSTLLALLLFVDDMFRNGVNMPKSVDVCGNKKFCLALSLSRLVPLEC